MVPSQGTLSCPVSGLSTASRIRQQYRVVSEDDSALDFGVDPSPRSLDTDPIRMYPPWSWTTS
jgi:hypothetical protein